MNKQIKTIKGKRRKRKTRKTSKGKRRKRKTRKKF
jgi:hypothetical protein